MARTTEESRQLFDSWAATYDASLRASGGILAGAAKSLNDAASMITVGPDETLLDIGIGTGRFAQIFAEQKARIFGADPSEKMIEKCRELHPDYMLAIGSFTDLPYRDREFDTVISSFAFHEVPPEDRPSACAGIVGALRPGGTFLLLDIIFSSAEEREKGAIELGDRWDPDEDYALQGELNALLLEAGGTMIRWQQVGPFHWAVTGIRG